MPDKPYISLPTLAAHLLHHQVPVALWDANLEFFRQVMAPGALLERLENHEGAGSIRDLFSDPDLSNRERLRLFGAYLPLVNGPGERERLGMTGNTGYLRYQGPGCLFSSGDLIRHARTPDSLTRRTCRNGLNALLGREHPDLVGISVAFPDQIQSALTLAAMVKEIDPGLPVVLGGPFVTLYMENCRNSELFSLVDYLALGDGETILTRLYAHLKTKGRNATGKADVPGVVFHDPAAGIVRTGAPLVFPMAASKAPAYGLLPLDRYLVPRRSGAVLFRLSRGCYWARCAFCNSCSPVINGHDRQDAAVLHGQLMRTLAETGRRIVHFTDDAADPELLLDIANRLFEEKQDLNWTVNVRVDRRLTLETLFLLRKAGCFSLFLGIESCSNRVLGLMNKGTTFRMIHQVLSNLSWAGINANIYMIVGFPTETETEARSSFEKVKEWIDAGLVNQVVYNLFSIPAQSPVARSPDRYGITAIDPTVGDLAPPGQFFQCRSGMTRETAARLFGEFTRTLKTRHGQTIL